MPTLSSVRDVGGTIHAIERSAPMDARATTQLDARDLIRYPLFASIDRSHELQCYIINDAVLHGAFDGLRKPGALIDEYCLGGNVSFDDIVPSRLTQNDEDCLSVIGFNWACINYYHWLAQALPSLYVLTRQFGLDGLQLILPDISPVQEQGLAALGLQALPRVVVRHDQQYQFRRVAFTNVLTARCTTYDGFASYVHRLKRGAATPLRTGRRLYVSRGDAKLRRLTNEAAVIRLVSRYGFEIVEAGRLTFAQQVQLFAEADIVVGPHGAGFANTMFCRPGTIVYECFAEQYHSACMCVIAQNMDLRYHADFFDCPGSSQSNDWDIDLYRFERRLKKLVHQL